MPTERKLPTVINGVAIDDLSSTVEAIKAVPGNARFKFRIHNEWTGSSQNRSTVDQFYRNGKEYSRETPFVLEADEPVILLGKDTAANPLEHLLHALASCLTISMVYQAAARGIEIEEVESSLEGDFDLHGFLDLDKNVRKGLKGIKVNFKIKAAVPDQRLQEIAQLASGHSPVFDSVTKGVPVSVTADRL